MNDQLPVYPADAFIGTVLNIFHITFNGYPLSFIVWNILLATLAVLAARYSVKLLENKKVSWFKKTVMFTVWLALLPNTAYLMTDIRHVIGYCPLSSYSNVCPQNAWMTLFFFLYAAFGWPSFVLAIRPFKRYVTKRFGKNQAILFATVACFFTAWGVLLGLINRFNSWELITKPGEIIIIAFSYFSQINALLNIFLMFIFLGFLYAVGEKIFVTTQHEQRNKLSKNK